MTDYLLKKAIENSETFNNFPKFKKGIVLSRKNIDHLLDLYGQAERLGIDYLKQNRNIVSSDFKLIEELIANK